MPASGPKKIAAFIVLGSSLVALAVALNIGWIVLNWREGLLLVLGIIFFLVIITGLVLNTIFLVREVRRNEQHDTFINAVTHELKTPLASIRLYLETLQRRELDPQKRKEFYGVMLQDSDRLMHLVDQVLHAARTPRHPLVHKAPVDVRPLVREILAVAVGRHHLPESALEYIDAVPDGASATVLGDAEELRVAISNLVDNAVKYSGHEVRVSVEVSTPEPERIAVRVRDRGIGISSAELKRVFRRFYRITEAVAHVKGTGLGLFIVQSVARKHGGRVAAESDGPGRGSTFTLTLPVSRGVRS